MVLFNEMGLSLLDSPYRIKKRKVSLNSQYWLVSGKDLNMVLLAEQLLSQSNLKQTSIHEQQTVSVSLANAWRNLWGDVASDSEMLLQTLRELGAVEEVWWKGVLNASSVMGKCIISNG